MTIHEQLHRPHFCFDQHLLSIRLTCLLLPWNMTSRAATDSYNDNDKED